MKVSDFIQKLDQSSFDSTGISAVLHCFAYDHNDSAQGDDLEKEARDSIKKISGENFSSFGTKLGMCLSECQKLLNEMGSQNSDSQYTKSLLSVKGILQKLSTIYSSVAADQYRKPDSTTSTLVQHEESLKEIKTKISELNNSVKEANSFIDDKIFTLLLNTVAILGIFVAIAFTGFGVMSIFSNIDITASLISVNAFLKNIFYLLLVTLISYNLLLLLIYFIFKLSRPLMLYSHNKRSDVNEHWQDRFKDVVNLTPFLWIDAAVCLLTVVTFICCLIF